MEIIKQPTEGAENKNSNTKNNRTGQRGIVLEEEASKSILKEKQQQKKLDFVPGIQQPEMTLEYLPKSGLDSVR